MVLFAPDTPGGVQGPAGTDKLVHVSVFALLAATACRRFGTRPSVVAALVGYAAVSELVQLLALPHRSGDWLDLVADAVGVALGVLCALPRSRGT